MSVQQSNWQLDGVHGDKPAVCAQLRAGQRGRAVHRLRHKLHLPGGGDVLLEAGGEGADDDAGAAAGELARDVLVRRGNHVLRFPALLLRPPQRGLRLGHPPPPLPHAPLRSCTPLRSPTQCLVLLLLLLPLRSRCLDRHRPLLRLRLGRWPARPPRQPGELKLIVVHNSSPVGIRLLFHHGVRRPFQGRAWRISSREMRLLRSGSTIRTIVEKSLSFCSDQTVSAASSRLMVFCTVSCFLRRSCSSRAGAARTPLRRMAGRCTSEHLAVTHTGISVTSSKKVTPSDQTSAEAFSPHTSTSSPSSCRTISGARYSGETSQSSPRSTPQVRFSKRPSRMVSSSRKEEQAHSARWSPSGRRKRFAGVILLLSTRPSTFLSSRQSCRSRRVSSWQWLASSRTCSARRLIFSCAGLASSGSKRSSWSLRGGRRPIAKLRWLYLLSRHSGAIPQFFIRPSRSMKGSPRSLNSFTLPTGLPSLTSTYTQNSSFSKVSLRYSFSPSGLCSEQRLAVLHRKESCEVWLSTASSSPSCPPSVCSWIEGSCCSIADTGHRSVPAGGRKDSEGGTPSQATDFERSSSTFVLFLPLR